MYAPRNSSALNSDSALPSFLFNEISCKQMPNIYQFENIESLCMCGCSVIQRFSNIPFWTHCRLSLVRTPTFLRVYMQIPWTHTDCVAYLSITFHETLYLPWGLPSLQCNNILSRVPSAVSILFVEQMCPVIWTSWYTWKESTNISRSFSFSHQKYKWNTYVCKQRRNATRHSRKKQ